MVKHLVSETYQEAIFPLASLEGFKQAALQWGQTFEQFCYLDSNNAGSQTYSSYEGLVGAGSLSELQLKDAAGAFEHLNRFRRKHPEWLFGFLGYDLKNDVEQLSSNNRDLLQFPVLHFFEPVYVLEIFQGAVRIHSKAEDPRTVFQKILDAPKDHLPSLCLPTIETRIPREQYLETVEKIHHHILEGDLYEMNFCQEFYVPGAIIDPPSLFQRLNGITQAPFSSYYRNRDQYLMGASPERFLKKEGRKLISQPIKGTIRRGQTAEEDLQLKEQLFRSEKDRSENIMIVDLVRNDLARLCLPGTVRVEELYGIYTFAQVHHMISTITGELPADISFTEAIRAAFPMGSMTGAPKVISMELIEAYEQSRRGLYSGAVGYLDPSGNFDFNVVIRSLLYRADHHYLSFQVGGAIVYDSDPAKEYEECMLKAKGLMQTLGHAF